MARYDLYSLGDGDLVMDVQADLLDGFKSRVVIPLLKVDSTPPAFKRLNPTFEIGGGKYVLATQLISAVPTSELTRRNQNLSKHHDQIVGALDMLFQGF